MMGDKLNLNPGDFTSLEEGQDLGERIVENRVMRDYLKLNKVGRKKLLDYMGDLALLGKYIT